MSIYKNDIRSPTHTYVAICTKRDAIGVHFKKFKMPDEIDIRDSDGVRCTVTPEDISPEWYFSNVVDATSNVEKVITYEDYCDVQEVK